MGKLPLVATISLISATCFAQPTAGEELYKKILPSIMTLTVQTDKGISQGSAFLSIRDGIAVTAWHVIAGGRSATAKFSDGEEFDVSGVLDFDVKRDVALIKVKVAGRPLLELDSTEIAVGSAAYALGAPRGLDFSISNGIVSQIQTVDSTKQVQFTCAVSPGNSGGPLVNNAGKVIGVVSWQLSNGQNLNFAVPSIYVGGLDSTLATTPWESVKARVPAVATKGLSRDSALQILKLRIEANKEIESAIDLHTAVTTVSPLRVTIPATVVSAMNALPRIRRQFAEIETDVPEVQKAVQAMVDSISESIDGFSKLVQATNEAKANLEWGASAETLLEMGMSKIFKPTKSPLVPLVPMLEAVLTDEDKQAFHPDLLKLFLSQSEDHPFKETFDTGLRWDVRTLPRQRLSSVRPSSAGHKAGLKPLDEVLTWNGKELSSWSAVDALLKESKGQKIKLRVRNPKGVERDLTLSL